MLSILLSWSIIGVYAYLYGRTTICLLYGKKRLFLQTWDIYITCGMIVLTVYAQFFSVFYKVGVVAFGVISTGAVLCAAYLFHEKIWDDVRINNSKGLRLERVILIVGIIGTLLWTNIIPQHYDTGLYHAQAIRWIEEYGVVPGLANLHFRFAYNSSFLPLQALFSFAWLSGRSLHTVNGFIVLCMQVYAVTSFRKRGGGMVQISDLLKLAMLAYFFYISMSVSSPNTDVPALLLVFYVCMKWSEFAECRVESVLPYSYLCILCVYSVTIKLSVAVFGLLVIYPAIILVKSKQWRQIINHVVAGLIIVMPWLVRNVIISGYLVYPYPEIDLFRVDWKLAEQTALADRREIVAWGRGNYDVSRYEDTLGEWFSEWFMGIHVLWQILFVIAAAATVVLLLLIIWDVLHDQNELYSLLGIVCIGGVVFWLLSAPLPRYGIVYMAFLPCITMGRILQNGSIKSWFEVKGYDRVDKAAKIFMSGFVVLYGLLFFSYSYMIPCGQKTLLIQNDYQNYDTIEGSLDGVIISRAAEGDQTGYAPFPATPYSGVLESIELRGNGLKEGFRRRERDVSITPRLTAGQDKLMK